jgi:hypothetical protein
MSRAAKAWKVSRATAYRILKELDVWEDKATDAQQAAEINAAYPKYDSMKWMLCSGKMLTAYARGEIDADLLGKADRANDIGVQDESDPLLA